MNSKFLLPRALAVLSKPITEKIHRIRLYGLLKSKSSERGLRKPGEGVKNTTLNNEFSS